MKKMIYLATVMLMVAMVSCGGHNSSLNEKGNKSEMDTLSYAFGINVCGGITYDMPDLKLDWDVMGKAMEKTLLAAMPTGEDVEKAEAQALLDEFFRGPRMERMNAKAEAIMASDSTHQLVREDFVDFDVFAGDEAQRKAISEAYGVYTGSNLRASRMPLKTYWLQKGMADYAAGETVITESFAQQFIQNYYVTEMPLQNAAESKAWLAEVEKQKGVQKTESGLLYRIDRAGDTSVMPTAEDTVVVDYKGELKDGYVFDSSYDRGESIEFPLNGVIKGWTEGLQLIGKGGKITLWIPSELGYGAYGSGSIGPNMALLFTVELHDVKRASEQSAE
jgi:FKBP-type peptidyl-prolyl cis-trans isomerase FkpA